MTTPAILPFARDATFIDAAPLNPHTLKRLLLVYKDLNRLLFDDRTEKFGRAEIDEHNIGTFNTFPFSMENGDTTSQDCYIYLRLPVGVRLKSFLIWVNGGGAGAFFFMQMQRINMATGTVSNVGTGASGSPISDAAVQKVFEADLGDSEPGLIIAAGSVYRMHVTLDTTGSGGTIELRGGEYVWNASSTPGLRTNLDRHYDRAHFILPSDVNRIQDHITKAEALVNADKVYNTLFLGGNNRPLGVWLNGGGDDLPTASGAAQVTSVPLFSGDGAGGLTVPELQNWSVTVDQAAAGQISARMVSVDLATGLRTLLGSSQTAPASAGIHVLSEALVQAGVPGDYLTLQILSGQSGDIIHGVEFTKRDWRHY